MTWTLDQYFAARTILNRVYTEELHRDIYSDHDAFVNWLFHMREEGADEAAIRAAVQDSDEWRAGQGGGVQGIPPSAPVPASPSAGVPTAAIAGGGRVVQVTDASDGVCGVRPYSYWPQVWIWGGAAIVFAGFTDGVIRFFRVDLTTLGITRLPIQFPIRGTGENMYWDARGKITYLEGPRLRRVDPFNLGDNEVLFDISTDPAYQNCDLWQPHSSDDGQTHSATVRRIVDSGSYPNIATVVSWQGQLESFPAHGTLDESQLDATGGFLTIKEKLGTPPNDRLTNRIITMGTRETRTIDNSGAVGHSDCGDGTLIGESSPQDPGGLPGAIVAWDLRQPLTPERRKVLLPTWNAGHVAVQGNVCLRSSETSLSLIDMQNGGERILVPHGMVTPPPSPGIDPYDYQVKANLDHTGRIGCFLSNRGTDHVDVFLLVL